MSVQKVTIFKDGKAVRVKLHIDPASGQYQALVTRLHAPAGEKTILYNSMADPMNDDLWLEFLFSRIQATGVEVPEALFAEAEKDCKTNALDSKVNDHTSLELSMDEDSIRSMSGLGDRSDDTRRYVRSLGLERGHWYVDPLRAFLYIVPNEKYGGAEISGPDEEALGLLEEVYREGDFKKIDCVDVASRCGLVYVPEENQNFSPERGYHVVI